MIKIIVDELIEAQRLDSALAVVIDGFSRSQIQSLVKKGDVRVNGELVKSSQKLKLNDVVEITPTAVEDKLVLEPENIPFDVVYEDENMAVINKPSGLLTHPTTQEMSGTLVNALLYKYGKNQW